MISQTILKVQNSQCICFFVSIQVNRTVENIGARRLHTVIERIMEDISFEAPDRAPGTRFVVDSEYVQSKIKDFTKNADMRKYIL